MTTHILVDARNAIYRAIYAVKQDQKPDKHNYIVALLYQFRKWIHLYKPDSVHVFWDAPRNTVWRRQLDPGYKNRDDNKYIEDISGDLKKTQEIAVKLFQYMNVRQYFKEGMEADDMIYAACTVLHPDKTIIVSTDSDLTQIPFIYSSAKVYNPKLMEEVETPTIHPAFQKALKGDPGDSVDGYMGIGPVKSKALLESATSLQDFLLTNGKERFMKNLMLVDLSLNPKLLSNQMYVRSILASSPVFDKDRIANVSNEHRIGGLMTNYGDIVVPFKNLK